MAKYHYDLGVVTQTHGQLAESIGHYQRALALDARSAATWENLGVALFDLDQNRESIIAFERALTFNPASLLALGNLCFQLGGVLSCHFIHADVFNGLRRLPGKARV